MFAEEERIEKNMVKIHNHSHIEGTSKDFIDNMMTVRVIHKPKIVIMPIRGAKCYS